MHVSGKCLCLTVCLPSGYVLRCCQSDFVKPRCTGPLLPKRMVAPAAQLLLKAHKSAGLGGAGPLPNPRAGHRERLGEHRPADGMGRGKDEELKVMVAVVKAVAGGRETTAAAVPQPAAPTPPPPPPHDQALSDVADDFDKAVLRTV